MRGVYLVTDRTLCGQRGVEEVAARAACAGACAVQLREKELCTREFVEVALRIKQALLPFRVPLIINDRVDVALAAGADGVHLGRSDMGYAEARGMLGAGAIIGLSLDNLEQLAEAEALDASYLAVSPVFATPTKTDVGPAWGLDGLSQARRCSRHTLVAIGGINGSNAASVTQAGADCLAVVSAICAAHDPYAETKRLLQIFEGAGARGD